MTRTRKNLLALAVVTALSTTTVVVAGVGAQAKDGTPAVATDAAALAHAQKVAPLNAIANALGEQGRGDFANSYGNLYVDENANVVTLYAINAEQGQKIIDAAKAAHPEIDTALIKVTIAKHTKKDLDAQVAKIMKATAVTKAADLELYTVAVAPDASGIQVTGKPDKLADIKSKIHGAAADLTSPVDITAGDAVKGASWRWNDGRPQIGGDMLVGASRQSGYNAECTAGLAAEDSSGRDYLITADHCFPGGSAYGEGGSTPGSYTWSFGGWIGWLHSSNDHWDAETIDTGAYNGAGSNSDEADQPNGQWYTVSNYAYSYNGQQVCQDGAHSYYDGHGVPCGITVQNEDVTYNLPWDDGSVHSVRGVQGYNSTWAVEGGDSGALVFTINSNTDRQARGIVSAQTNNQTIYWTEATDILGSLGLHLNPHV